MIKFNHWDSWISLASMLFDTAIDFSFKRNIKKTEKLGLTLQLIDVIFPLTWFCQPFSQSLLKVNCTK